MFRNKKGRNDKEVTDLKNPIDLSVCIITFNHEKYIERAIESVLMQETSYRFEIIIVDDNSPDGTPNIISKYIKKYPNIITGILLKENTFKKIDNAFSKSIGVSRGKYVVILEGDDYWIDERKIQKQLDFLNNNKEYIGVSHKCIVVDANSKRINEEYPSIDGGDYCLKDWFQGKLPGQTTTLMYINPKFHNNIDWSLCRKGLMPGDRLNAYVLAINGKVFCIDEYMSAYRHVVDHGTSFSANNKYSFMKDKRWYGEVVEYTYLHGTQDQVLDVEVLYFENIIRGCVKNRKILFDEFINNKYISSGYIKICLFFILKIFNHIMVK